MYSTRNLSAFSISFFFFLGHRIELLFNKETAHTWVTSGLGTKVFLASTSFKDSPQFIRFESGQPLGFLSSWPLFALCHHFCVWLAADKVYPNKRFRSYALLGDDLVIADRKVAEAYKYVMSQLGV